MISIMLVFYIFVAYFAVTGFMRGWAKEMLVSVSVLLALALIGVIEYQIPVIRDMIIPGSRGQFRFRMILFGLIVLFGYQTPNLPRLASSARREKFRDSILGVFFGATNGYLIVGSIWDFVDTAGYFPPNFARPEATDPMGEAAVRMLEILPPTVLSGDTFWVYIVAILAAILVIILIV